MLVIEAFKKEVRIKFAFILTADNKGTILVVANTRTRYTNDLLVSTHGSRDVRDRLQDTSLLTHVAALAFSGDDGSHHEAFHNALDLHMIVFESSLSKRYNKRGFVEKNLEFSIQ